MSSEEVIALSLSEQQRCIRYAATQWNLLFPENMFNEILKWLSIPDLCRCQTVCTLWRRLLVPLLEIHHYRFTARIRLYTTIINDYERADGSWGTIRVTTSHNLRSIRYETIPEKYLVHNTSFQIHSEKSYLNGEIYEHDYDENSSRFTIYCKVCRAKAYLPVMIKGTGHDTDFNCYYPTYGTVCLKCLNNKDEAVLTDQSNLFHETVPIIGLNHDQFKKITLDPIKEIKPCAFHNEI